MMMQMKTTMDLRSQWPTCTSHFRRFVLGCIDAEFCDSTVWMMNYFGPLPILMTTLTILLLHLATSFFISIHSTDTPAIFLRAFTFSYFYTYMYNIVFPPPHFFKNRALPRIVTDLIDSTPFFVHPSVKCLALDSTSPCKQS